MVRENGDLELYDLSPGQSYQSVSVNTGDLVFVPRFEQAHVEGYVLTPGSLLIQGRIRIDHALARVGGPIYDRAKLDALVIMRSGGQRVEVSVSEAFWRDVKERPDDDYYLTDGDVLFVPNAYKTEKIYVLGYVRNAGAQPVRGPVTLRRAIALAGGFEQEAKREKAIITRRDGTVEEINRSERDRQKSGHSDVLLYPGDTVEIPKRTQLNWSLILSFISVTAVVAGIIIGK